MMNTLEPDFPWPVGTWMEGLGQHLIFPWPVWALEVRMTSKERVPESFSPFLEELSAASEVLNVASDELGKPIPALNDFLKNLNLGIATWVKFEGGEDDLANTYWQNSIGYSRVKGKWGIVISKEIGNLADPDHGDYEAWHFHEAPRSLRIKAIDKLPELLATLVQETQQTITKIKAKSERTNELTKALQAINPKKK